MRFTKMHGCANDYVYIDCFENTVDDRSSLAIKISDRHTGVGSDGLILIDPSDRADCFMDMYNWDGSRSEMCGNGIRCVGKYLYNHGRVKSPIVTIDTLAGIKTLKLHIENGVCVGATVDMGAPILTPADIPTTLGDGSLALDCPLEVCGTTYRVSCVSMGNPHAVVVVDDPENFPVHEVGAAIEKHPAFPRKTNVAFIARTAPNKFRIRTWERGAGETMACGTNNCGAVVAATLLGLCDGVGEMHTNGGVLNIEWDRQNDRVLMTGPAVEVFSGEFNM